MTSKTTAILTLTTLVSLAALVLLTSGCSGRKQREDPILALSAAEALEIGKQLLAEEKFFKAQRHLTHAFEVEPNSRGGREALLLAADALFLDGGTDNFIRCEAKYRDFLNRFPTSERADYAQFQVANCLAKRSEKPDRDQAVTGKALQAYEELLRLYPTSSYIPEAREKIREVTDLLAAHELVVADFYLRYGRGSLCIAAIKRIEYVQEEYPDFSRMEDALYSLGLAYETCRRPEDAEATFQELREKYPDSEYLEGLEKKRRQAANRIKVRQRRG